MRRNAGPSPVGANLTSVRRLKPWSGRAGLACLSVFCLAALLFAAAPALAGTVTNERPLLFSFTGADASAGSFSEAPEGVSNIAVDNETGAVYVAANGSPESGFVSKFNSDGTAADFSTAGSSSLTGFSNELGVAVNNSGGSNQGRIYVSQFGDTRARAFDAGGNLLWTLFPSAGQLGDIAVDASGHPWTGPSFGAGADPSEYDAAGSPPAPTGCSISTGGTNAIDLDASGNVYLQLAGSIRKYTKVGSCTYTESTLDSSATNVYTDQSSASGHIFTIEGGAFSEYDASGTELGTFGSPYVRYGKSIAYNPAKDWVYVLQGSPSNRVAVFGPAANGTVPDVTEINAALTSAEISTAHFSGKVNPQGTSSKWHFEWKRTAQAWDEAGTSPSQSLPVDSAEHAVEFDTKALRGDTTYEVRLVTVNNGNGLRSFSGVESFTTSIAPAPPDVTIDAPTSVTTTTAVVDGTVNPKGDTADWRVQISTDSACESGFSDQPLQTLGEASETPVPIEYVLTGLLSDERYCVRIVATNSGGTTTSEVKQFTSEPIVPDELETAFVAPRTDTTARLNGRINPEGAELTYHFEYSQDGGETWQALPDHTDTSEARRQIVVAEDVGGLTNGKTYSYRFLAENAVGQASPQGTTKMFRTRSAAELTLPEPRGIELVNNPDKGNQNVEIWPSRLDTPQQTPNGEKVLWRVAGGAPGGNSGTGSLFLAERSPSGWRSRSVQPPADQQVGEGEFAYVLAKATPGFNRFIFITGRSNPVGGVAVPTALVRLDDAQDQEILTNDPTHSGPGIEITDDGSHVVQRSGFVSGETRQLVEVGGGVPQVLSFMPDGTESSCGLEGKSFGGDDNVGAGAQWRPGYQMIATTDASRAYFQVPPNGECGGLFGIYERNREAGETTLIDPGASGHDPEFIRATPDGRHAYFVTYSKLDPSDTNQDADIYRWDEEAGESTCLTCVVPDANLLENEVPTDVMVSDDFSHIYFESRSQLVPGEGKVGDVNLYVLSDGMLRFVADNTDAVVGVLRYEASSRAQLSRDGSVLIFKAPASRVLTADAVARECPEVAGFHEIHEGLNVCEELYRYDDRDGSLECLSCEQGAVTTNSVGTQVSEGDPVFKMSADGSTVAFATAQTLLPRDINRGTDIYEWRNGSLRLLTDGVSSFPNGFAAPQVRGVDADGSDILFSVVAPGLTGFEQDGVANLYDARIGGGFVPPSPPVHCTEESCQGPLQVAPGTTQPGSATLSGPGNAKTGVRKRRCAHKRGKAKRRCIRRHKNRSGKAGGRSR